VGFDYQLGSAGGFIADMFVEFSWLGMVVCFAIGKWYTQMWRRWRTDSAGFWTLAYVSQAALSIYLPTQSVQAWLYRSLIIILPSWLFWDRVIARKSIRAGGRLPEVSRVRTGTVDGN